MTKRIPVKDVRDFAKAHGLTHVIVFGYSGLQHVATWGKTTVNAAEAADLGNKMKAALNWPESLCHAEPSRVAKLKARVAELEDKLAAQATCPVTLGCGVCPYQGQKPCARCESCAYL